MKIFLSVFLSFVSWMVYGQNATYIHAMDRYSSRAYSDAIPLLHKSLKEEKTDEKRALIHFALGRCYEENSDYTSALHHYEAAESLSYGTQSTLSKARMQKTLGDYSAALSTMEEYRQMAPSSPMTDILIQGIRDAMKTRNTHSPYTVIPLPDINSVERDFAPNFYPSTKDEYMIFTSSRHASMSSSDDARTGESSSHLYMTRPLHAVSVMESGIWQQPLPWNTPAERKDHTGAACFSHDGKEVFFTLCPYSEKDMGCVIAFSLLLSDGTWSSPVTVIRSDSTHAVGHPSLSKDGKKLFFSMETSRGDKDIYAAVRRDTFLWDTPVPIGAVNSNGDDMYPFVSADGTLYFSSDGHTGMGGLDIFRSEWKNGRYSAPVNMGFPINSSADDFSLALSSDEDSGAMSSNRDGGVGKDDIYLIRRIPRLYAMEGVVIDNITGLPIDDARIRIEGSDGSINTLHSDAKGIFRASSHIIHGDNTYKISVEKDRYLVVSFSLSTFGVEDEEFSLTPQGYLYTTHLIAEIDPMSSPIVLPRIEYDFDRAALRDESKKALDSLVLTLEENPDIVIELRAHTDHKGSDEYNDVLSEKRAAACVEYLISRGVDPYRLQSRGMGKKEPFIIPEYFTSSFPAGTVLSEDFINSLRDASLDEEARQYNRRTDFKVLGVLTQERQSVQNPAAVSYTEDSLLAVSSTSYRIDTLKTTSEEMFSSSHAESSARVLFYTLKKGDNYGTVSSFFGIPVTELRRINGGLRGISPYEGMILKVNVTADYSEYDKSHHRVERTENTWEKILSVTGLTQEQFMKLNPSFDRNNIRAGMMIVTSPYDE